MKKSTMELLESLQTSVSINDYFDKEKENLTKESLSDALTKLLAKHNLKKADVIRRCGLDSAYAYQIFSGDKEPSRTKLLALCFGMQLSAEETQILLKTTGYPPLYPRIECDAVILFSLEKKLGLMDANEFLYDLGFDLLE